MKIRQRYGISSKIVDCPFEELLLRSVSTHRKGVSVTVDDSFSLGFVLFCFVYGNSLIDSVLQKSFESHLKELLVRHFIPFE